MRNTSNTRFSRRQALKLVMADTAAFGIGVGIASGQSAAAATPAPYVVQVGAAVFALIGWCRRGYDDGLSHS